MKPASNLTQVVPGLWSWSSLHEEWKIEFSSHAWQENKALVLIDPVKLDETNLARLESVTKPTAILLTNENHERDADWYRARYAVKVHVHHDAIPGIEIEPDELFGDGASLPGGLTAVHLPGTCRSECAFYTPACGGVLFIGDALINNAQGLAFLPDEHCMNPTQNRESVRKLLDLAFEVVTFAHGAPITHNAKAQLQALLAH
ncbi:MAG: hypothetical protein N3G20_08495 [Verrucomicrobiae bacterium]|nr:hypothetical protein [Verrucomicrobiae bacterium]